MAKHIFLSYSREDAERAQDLVRDVEAFGHTVWLDEAIGGGQPWWQEILRRIREADCFLIAVTKHSIESEACQREWKYAQDLARGIIPVKLDRDVPDPLPAPLGDYQWLPYSGGDTADTIALLRAIEELPTDPLPTELPPDPEVPGSYLVEIQKDVLASASMDLPGQLALVFRIKQRLAEGRDEKDLLDLLRRFRGRDDLLAKVAEDIDAIIAEHESRPAAKTAAPKARKPEEEAGAERHVKTEDPDATSAKKREGSTRREEKVGQSWSTELIEFMDSYLPTIEVKLVLTESEHILRFRDGAIYGRLFVDGKEVAKTSNPYAKFEFTVTDGDKLRKGTADMKMGLAGAGKLVSFDVTVEGRKLYELKR